MKRKITVDEYYVVCDMLYTLTDILLAVGIIEFRVSKKEKEIYWDTENGAQIDPTELDRFSCAIDKHFMDIAMRQEKANEI